MHIARCYVAARGGYRMKGVRDTGDRVVEHGDRAVTVEEYLSSVGQSVLQERSVGATWEWDPINSSDICPLDDQGVAYLEQRDGAFREVWHVDGLRVDDAGVWHICYRGSEDHGWARDQFLVGSQEFAERLVFCRDDEARWQSWWPYYDHVLGTGDDPLGVFSAHLRRAARDALAELSRPIRVPAGRPQPVPPGT